MCVLGGGGQTSRRRLCDKPQWTKIFPEASDGQRISLSFEVCVNTVKHRTERSSISSNPYLCLVTITSSIYGIYSHCVVLVAKETSYSDTGTGACGSSL